MKLGIEGRRALVTGAGRGIGRAIALSLAEEGAQVTIVSRTEEDVARLVEDMGSGASGHRGVAMDLMPNDAPQRLLRELATNGAESFDIVVHNVGGTLDITDPFCSIDEWRRSWRFNMEIAVELNLALVPAMQKKRWGRILHISSISAIENHGPVTYCAVKAALTAYTRSMGRVLAPDGIVMTALLPGAVFTEKGYWDVTSKERPEHVERYLADRMAIKRLGLPEEMGSLAAFLCSEHASFCIGSVLVADGGQGRSFQQQPSCA